jgi:hypothetical protein
VNDVLARLVIDPAPEADAATRREVEEVVSSFSP